MSLAAIYVRDQPTPNHPVEKGPAVAALYRTEGMIGGAEVALYIVADGGVLTFSMAGAPSTCCGFPLFTPDDAQPGSIPFCSKCNVVSEAESKYDAYSFVPLIFNVHGDWHVALHDRIGERAMADHGDRLFPTLSTDERAAALEQLLPLVERLGSVPAHVTIDGS